MQIAARAAQQLHQLRGEFGRVVDAVEHAVLERDEVARRHGQVAHAGLHQLSNRVFFVERHQAFAQGVRGRVQGHGQRHRAVLAQAVHHGHHARGGHGDAPARQAVGVVVEHDLEGGHEFGVILQGLAHAHHHHVRDDAFVARQVFAQKVLGKPELRDDFARRQIAAKALVAGGAKAAAHGATRLRRNAQRATVRFGDKNGLYRVARTHVKQPLDGAVGGFVLGHNAQRRHLGAALELFAQGLGQIGHGVKLGRAFLVDPAKQLDRPKALLA